MAALSKALSPGGEKLEKTMHLPTCSLCSSGFSLSQNAFLPTSLSNPREDRDPPEGSFQILEANAPQLRPRHWQDTSSWVPLFTVQARPAPGTGVGFEPYVNKQIYSGTLQCAWLLPLRFCSYLPGPAVWAMRPCPVAGSLFSLGGCACWRRALDHTRLCINCLLHAGVQTPPPTVVLLYLNDQIPAANTP